MEELFCLRRLPFPPLLELDRGVVLSCRDGSPFPLFWRADRFCLVVEEERRENGFK
jgi:hypothetical protein